MVAESRQGKDGRLQRLKWFLWHGNVFRALQTVQDLEIDLDVEEPSVSQTKLLKAVREFGGYLTANASCIPNYGERRRAGETISTSFVESTVNQVISQHGQKTADALEPPQCAPAPPDTHPHPQRHPHQRLPTLVPQLHPHPRSTAPGRITSHGFSHSRLVAWSQVVKRVFISWRYWAAVSRWRWGRKCNSGVTSGRLADDDVDLPVGPGLVVLVVGV